MNGGRERRRRGRLTGGRYVDPQLVDRPQPRRARVEQGARRLPIGDHGVAVDRREPPENADDPRCDLLALDLERNDPVRPRLGRDAPRREHGQRHAVGRLVRPERAVTVRRQQVAETGRAAATPPVPSQSANGAPRSPLTRAVPNVSTPLRSIAIRCPRSPRHAARRTGCRAEAGRALHV